MAIKIGVGYTVVKTTFFVSLLREQFLCVPFTLSQHEMTIFFASGPTKKCAGPKSKMAAIFPENHIFGYNFVILWNFHKLLVSLPMF